MPSQTTELVTAWCNWEPGSPPYFLDGDDALLSKAASKERIATHSSWEAYIGEPGFGLPGDTRLHLGLVPVPFAGDLGRARVFVLLLNPGLEPDDYFAEYKVPGFRDRLIWNLKQDFSRSEYPFVYLDPSISWHSGYRWWHGKFQGVIADLAKKWDVGFADARQYFSNILACVELVPYHSVSYNLSDRIREQMRSVRIAREHVHECLRPRAQAGEVLIVVTRHCVKWGLPESSHVVTYLGSETRAAHLSPNSRGGKRIVEFVRELRP
jgi:hypothetical protein